MDFHVMSHNPCKIRRPKTRIRFVDDFGVENFRDYEFFTTARDIFPTRLSRNGVEIQNSESTMSLK
jgi:hypothetical protein